MVSKQAVQKQLKKIGFNATGWGRGEISELHNILLPDENVLEAVNGFYEGGFAMLLATDVRVLLVDKKPLSFLTVEDLRFDMINEMDYNHRLIGANINIASGDKKMKFTSWNQYRLRKLINHVQHEMASSKKKQSSHQEDQKQHLEQINQQLQTYLMAQHQYQQQMQQIQQAQQHGQPAPPMPEPVQPSDELKDYLLAQRLLAEHNAQTNYNASQQIAPPPARESKSEATADSAPAQAPTQASTTSKQVTEDVPPAQTSQIEDLYNEGMKEIFGRQVSGGSQSDNNDGQSQDGNSTYQTIKHALEVNPMKIASSKLPMALRNRRFGRPSFHAHSASESKPLEDEQLEPAAS